MNKTQGLCEAIEWNNIADVNRFLELGANPNGYNGRPISTALELNDIFHENKVEILISLLKHGANVEFVDKNGNFCLDNIVRSGTLEQIKNALGCDLLKNRNSINHQAIFTAMNKNNGSLELLIQHGVNLNIIKADRDETPLCYALIYRYSNAVSILLDAGVDLSRKNGQISSLLSYAINRPLDSNTEEEKFLEMVENLVQKGVDINENLYVDDDGKTLLMRCVSNKPSINVFKRLSELGADVDKQDKNGDSALLYAAKDGYISTIRYLLEIGSNPAILNKKGRDAKEAFIKGRYRHSSVTVSDVDDDYGLEVIAMLDSATEMRELRKTIDKNDDQADHEQGFNF